MAEVEPAWHESQDWGESAPSERVTQFKSIPELAKGYDEAVSKIQSKGILIPDEKASEEDQAAFKTTLKEHLGIAPPESPDKYSWKPEKGMEDYFKDSAERMKAYHEAGLDDKTVSMFMSKEAEQINAINGAIMEAQAETAKASEAALTEKWGDDYVERLGGVNKLKERFPDAVSQLVAGGLANSQPILEMMDEVARSIREEAPAGRSKGDEQGARAELDAIKASPAYKSGRNPGHKAAMARVMELQKVLSKFQS